MCHTQYSAQIKSEKHTQLRNWLMELFFFSCSKNLHSTWKIFYIIKMKYHEVSSKYRCISVAFRSISIIDYTVFVVIIFKCYLKLLFNLQFITLFEFSIFFCFVAVLMCVDGLLRKRFCGQTQIHLDLERTFWQCLDQPVSTWTTYIWMMRGWEISFFFTLYTFCMGKKNLFHILPFEYYCFRCIDVEWTFKIHQPETIAST